VVMVGFLKWSFKTDHVHVDSRVLRITYLPSGSMFENQDMPRVSTWSLLTALGLARWGLAFPDPF